MGRTWAVRRNTRGGWWANYSRTTYQPTKSWRPPRCPGRRDARGSTFDTRYQNGAGKESRRPRRLRICSLDWSARLDRKVSQTTLPNLYFNVTLEYQNLTINQTQTL